MKNRVFFRIALVLIIGSIFFQTPSCFAKSLAERLRKFNKSLPGNVESIKPLDAPDGMSKNKHAVTVAVFNLIYREELRENFSRLQEDVIKDLNKDPNMRIILAGTLPGGVVTQELVERVTQKFNADAIVVLAADLRQVFGTRRDNHQPGSAVYFYMGYQVVRTEDAAMWQGQASDNFFLNERVTNTIVQEVSQTISDQISPPGLDTSSIFKGWTIS